MYTYLVNDYMTIYSDFLMKEECDDIINFYKSKKEEDLKSVTKMKGHPGRVSISPTHDTFAIPIVNKLSELFNIDLDRFENTIQIFRNIEGDFVMPHHDSISNVSEDKKTAKQHTIGNRNKTFIIYLNNDYTGGETVFPEWNVTIAPQPGLLLLFDTVKDGNFIYNSLHYSHPVEEGEKYIFLGHTNDNVVENSYLKQKSKELGYLKQLQ